MGEVTADQIEAASFVALRKHGAADWIARVMAQTIRASEAYGNRICGLYYLESYCQQLASGRVRGDVEPVITRPRSGLVLVDAKHGFAQPAFARALPQAMDAALDNGIASLRIAHAHTCTALTTFTEAIARAGFIGMGFTNATPIVAPPGGKTRVIGTNPISFAAPDGQGGVAMLFDQSTTAVALGKITMAKAAGEAIPEGWALDAEGAPTIDPNAALQGSLASSGGYKGWGLGLMAEVMASALNGTTPSRDVAPLKEPKGAPHDLGHSFILIDPSVEPSFAAAMTGLAAAVSQDAGCRMPGQGKVAQETIEVPETLWQSTLALGA